MRRGAFAQRREAPYAARRVQRRTAQCMAAQAHAGSERVIFQRTALICYLQAFSHAPHEPDLPPQCSSDIAIA